MTHELIRHRHLSFSQLSQRFVDETLAEFVMPPALDNDEDRHWLSEVHIALETYHAIAKRLQDKGLTRKQAREAARAVLPNATETRIVVTGNMRAWREFIAKRNTPAADAEIRELAREIQRQLTELAPNTFQDMGET